MPAAVARDRHRCDRQRPTSACKSSVDTVHEVAMTYVEAVPAANVVVLVSGGKKGTCAGDSGGPDVVVSPTGALTVFGLVMTGPASCDAGISVDTMVATDSA